MGTYLGLAALVAACVLVCWEARAKPHVTKRWGTYVLGGFVVVFVTFQVAEVAADSDCSGECDLRAIALVSWVLIATMTMLGGVAVSEVSLLWARRRRARARRFS